MAKKAAKPEKAAAGKAGTADECHRALKDFMAGKQCSCGVGAHDMDNPEDIPRGIQCVLNFVLQGHVKRVRDLEAQTRGQ